jgi:hypothetical protein
MHPDIEKFYTDAGLDIAYMSKFYAWAIKVEGVYSIIARRESDNQVLYELEGAWYDEEEMLRIIKLKAFL